MAQVHGRATANLAAGFLSALVTKAPFPIRAVQVDGGSEFMAEFEEACRSLGIRLFVLPPRSPKLNGHAGMQRTFRDKFYTRPLPRGLTRLQAEPDAYLAYYNRRRPHMALRGLSSCTLISQHGLPEIRLGKALLGPPPRRKPRRGT
ncbi:hypothetical protein TthHB5018_c25560 (plasmid) [Thermus thermophilus]|uniref:Integrase catalytic domain-containing protein n=1 Tax=Thermus thermophilus TaxID=274 RepID=A0A7R7TGC2_THETH|nr:hypothetical protein TthHB5018_c25560 [Thermus thermophilus]